MNGPKYNDVIDFRDAGGDMEQVRQAFDSSRPLPDDVLQRVIRGTSATTTGNDVPAVPPVPAVTGVPTVTGTLSPYRTITADVLQTTEFTEPDWVIPNLLPVGLAILAGRPKVGKSWLALNLAVAVANGGRFLGTVETIRSEVLYLALEDNHRRLQGRLNTILTGERTEAPAGLQFTTDARPFDSGGFEDLRDHLHANPGVRLVIIDTLQRVRGKAARGKDTYAGDYQELGTLQRIALDCKVALVVVHHTTKMNYADPFDSISGTSGISGAADTLFVLARVPEMNGLAFQSRGRDTEELSIAVKFDPTRGAWFSLGEVDDVKLSEERRGILEALKDGDTLSPKEIAEATGLTDGATRKLLHKMKAAGTVESPSYGKYKLPVTVGTLETPGTGETPGTDHPPDLFHRVTL